MKSKLPFPVKENIYCNDTRVMLDVLYDCFTHYFILVKTKTKQTKQQQKHTHTTDRKKRKGLKIMLRI